MRPGAIVGPLILIAVGMLFLVNNFVADIEFSRLLRDFWPFLLIAVGVAQLPGVVLGGPKGRWGYLSGGVILITIGTLFAMQTLGDIRFGRTWPVLLVVIGLLGILKIVFAPVLLADRGDRWFRGGLTR